MNQTKYILGLIIVFVMCLAIFLVLKSYFGYTKVNTVPDYKKIQKEREVIDDFKARINEEDCYNEFCDVVNRMRKN